MIQSMTGYGAATVSSERYRLTIELKSLNSKYLELITKLPRGYMKYEHKIRGEVSSQLKRGKISLMFNVEVLKADGRTLNINQALVKKYMEELENLAEYLEVEAHIDLPLLLNLPEVIPTDQEDEDPEEWQLFEQALKTACKRMIESRTDEGKALDRDLGERISSIRAYLEEVKKLAPGRLDYIRNRIDQAFEEIKHKVEADPNRFEQELLFYMEKYDINEEIVRLEQHLSYFDELRFTEESNGKQLQFLSQEMGREINTIGSKANDANIQRNVVGMKDELEKIKEQVLNVV